jgi:hypothetical protein
MKKIIAIAILSIATLNGFSQKKTTKNTDAAVTPATETSTNTTTSTNTSTAAAPITEAQKAKMKEITKEFKASKTRIESDATLTEEQKKAQLKEASKLKSKKMKEIFTPEQLAQMKNEHKDKKGGE